MQEINLPVVPAQPLPGVEYPADMPPGTVMRCRYFSRCGRWFPVERYLEMGYEHCTHDECVAAWRRDVVHERFRVDLMPKVGLQWSFKGDPTAVGIGKSSGRTA